MKTGSARQAFTLIELLTVIAIIGILAGIALPNIGKFKPSVMSAATRQMLDAVARARQLAISQRTTVYLVFVPADFFNDPVFKVNWRTTNDLPMASSLLDKQMVGYNFVSLRSLGDQPGQATAKYYGPWRSLPEGTAILPAKLYPYHPTANPPTLIYTNDLNGNRLLAYSIPALPRTTDIPFPLADTPASGNATRPYISMPYIAFDYLGRLTSQQNEIIPLMLANVQHGRDPNTKAATASVPVITENPAGNSTNAYNVINVDWLTGRGKAERLEVR